MVDFTSTFNKCLSPDFQIRTQGENEIKQYEEHNDYSSQLFNYFTSLTTQPQYAQLAAVNLKNYIIKRWAPEDGPTIMPEAKNRIKAYIYPAMLSSPPSISAQLRESIECIAKYDFPHD